MSSPVSFLVFDVETVGDGDLIARVRYPNEELTSAEALRRHRDELIEQTGKDVLPPTFVVPISVAVAKVGRDFRLIDLVTLDEPEFRASAITHDFWKGWEAYRRPTFVTFNGRGYDLPVMEFAAYRYGLSLPAWFNVDGRSFEQRRNRYNNAAHIDLMDLLSNFGAVRLTGGLNLFANLIGKPGKTGIDGSQVQDMYDAGKVAEINDYCRCDVLDSYFVFLRSRVLTGQLPLEDEQKIVDKTHAWLDERKDDSAAFRHYLEHWGDWKSRSDASASDSS
ncbi:3'-5' exonuclease [Stratiformator vulcanicus]|uniref:Putative 3'-5' exonuclease related to the exonuclease domain of PolB n=1 Tax=Stratiformator vulcanicus TaxID=2527980 RepID=A0A517R7B1_9PLAN|nr:3'-5' exonuclease [Stratiformator vulcanicus]QDT39780.1 putative 3'-5' exonuclease related to the exonuclease domain of PolB [Stratiformator vulcanicus]